VGVLSAFLSIEYWCTSVAPMAPPSRCRSLPETSDARGVKRKRRFDPMDQTQGRVVHSLESLRAPPSSPVSVEPVAQPVLGLVVGKPEPCPKPKHDPFAWLDVVLPSADSLSADPPKCSIAPRHELPPGDLPSPPAGVDPLSDSAASESTTWSPLAPELASKDDEFIDDGDDAWGWFAEEDDQPRPLSGW